MKKIIRLQLFLAIILTAISFQSFGFWIGTEGIVSINGNDGIGGIHQGITTDAAKQYKFEPIFVDKYNFCSDGCSFTDEIIEVLKTGNIEMDGGAFKDNPSFHCDNEKIQECSNIIYNGRRKIVNEIVAFSHDLERNRYDQKHLINSQNMFGNISHTLQDFYSHSNWVEKHRGLSNPVETPYDFSGEPFNSVLLPVINNGLITEKFRYIPKVFANSCITTARNEGIEGTALYLDALTSGYYKDTPDIWEIDSYYDGPSSFDAAYISEGLSKNGPYFVNWKYHELIEITASGLGILHGYGYLLHEEPLGGVREKCQHGRWSNNIAGGLLSNHFGIAKDSPNRRFHIAARQTATEATSQLIEAIVKDVRDVAGTSESTDRAILGFLGHYRGEALINTKVNALHLGGCRSQGVPNTLDPNWKKGNTNWQTCNVVNACLEVGACGSDKSTDLLAKDNASITKTVSRNDSDEFCTLTQAVSIGTANADSRLDSTAFLSSNVSVSISKPSKFCNSTWYNTSAYSELEDTIHIVGGDLGTHKGLILHFTVSSGLSPGSAHGWPADTEVQLLDTKGDKSICSQKTGFFPVLKDDGTVVSESFNYGEFSSAACTLELPPNFIGRDFRYAIGLQVNALSSYAGTSTADATVRLSKITFNDGVTTPESIGARIEFNSGIPSPN